MKRGNLSGRSIRAHSVPHDQVQFHFSPVQFVRSNTRSRRFPIQVNPSPPLQIVDGPGGATNIRRNKVVYPKHHTRLIVVYGYGCDVLKKTLKERREELKNIVRKAKTFTLVDVMCNDRKPQSMTKNIARRLWSAPNKLNDTDFVKEVAEKVNAALNNGESVTLVGHSYGGSVVSRIATFLKATHKTLPPQKFRAVTFGSIYIPSASQTNGVTIEHYTYDNDIAKLCHKRGTNCEFVHILEPPESSNPFTSHISYDPYIKYIAKTGILPQIGNNRYRRAFNSSKVTPV